MKPTVEINLPVNKVVQLFMDKNNYKEWKKDLLSCEHVSGTPGKAGAITKLVFKRVTLFETITAINLPAEINCEYEHKRGEKTVMFHKASNRFTSLAENKTLLESDMQITKVIGLLPKIIMTLMAGAGKRYAQEQLNQFKKFAESKN